MTRSKGLVVDDDPNIVELVKLYLERDGCRVRVARVNPCPISPLASV